MVLIVVLLSACDQFSRPIPKADDLKSPRLTKREQRVEKGRNLYQRNCASCHNPMKDFTGPALHDIFIGRDTDFLYRFLTQRKSVKRDTAIRRRVREFGMPCMEFPALSREDVRSLEVYFRQGPVGCRFE